jgi:hypothetical protein
MKKIILIIFLVVPFKSAFSQSFVGISVHNNQYSFLSEQNDGDWKNRKTDKINGSLMYRQQIFKYLDACIEVGYEQAKIYYDITFFALPSYRDKFITEPKNLLMPIYLQPKYRYKNVAIHLNAGIAPQYLISHKTHYENNVYGTNTQIITDNDNQYNYSFITGGGLDYYLIDKWLISVNYFNGQVKKEWKSVVGYPFITAPMIYKNNRISLSLAYNLAKNTKK